mgnify:CR=1 FL=1
MTSRIGVGIIGFGTVGTGVAKVLLDNAALIRRREVAFEVDDFVGVVRHLLFHDEHAVARHVCRNIHGHVA